jgi:murein DD-endopeptidase MepM/ murein hydrolase activator NlpD
MQKNKKEYYNYLLTYKTKSKIYIRPIEVSKKVLHSSLAIILTTGIFSAGIIGLSKSNILAKSGNPIPAENLVVQQTAISQNQSPKTINYSRPTNAEDFALNSGGPISELQITEEEFEQAEKGNIEAQIKLLRANMPSENMPTMWAHLGKINNEFGFRRNPFGGRSYEFHAGMDIDGERGDTVVAPGTGVILKAGWQGGYGYMIEIDHGNGLTTRYGHLSKVEVEVGDTVQRGQLIGLVGSTGRSTGPHLHYELRLNEKAINPRLFLPPEPTEIKQG